jgi:hypothetical protein
MAQRIFEPVISTFLKTDGVNHGKDIEFKISYGFELKNPHPIFKVQMVGGGYIKGRQAPSYSDDDFDKIIQIRTILKSYFQNLDPKLRDKVRDDTIEIPGLTTKHSSF